MSRVIKQDPSGRAPGPPRRVPVARPRRRDRPRGSRSRIFVLIYSGFSILWDFFNSDTVQIKVQSPGINVSGMWLTFVVYLSLGWASTGRTIGKQVMGLRVVRTRRIDRCAPDAGDRPSPVVRNFYPGAHDDHGPVQPPQRRHRTTRSAGRSSCTTGSPRRPSATCRRHRPRRRSRRRRRAAVSERDGRVAPCSRDPRGGRRARRACPAMLAHRYTCAAGSPSVIARMCAAA